MEHVVQSLVVKRLCLASSDSGEQGYRRIGMFAGLIGGDGWLEETPEVEKEIM